MPLFTGFASQTVSFPPFELSFEVWMELVSHPMAKMVTPYHAPQICLIPLLHLRVIHATTMRSCLTNFSRQWLWSVVTIGKDDSHATLPSCRDHNCGLPLMISHCETLAYNDFTTVAWQDRCGAMALPVRTVVTGCHRTPRVIVGRQLAATIMAGHFLILLLWLLFNFNGFLAAKW